MRTFYNMHALNWHLQEFGIAVVPGDHGGSLGNQAGRHLTPRLKLLKTITILTLLSRSPEINSDKSARQLMRDNWLSNRVFEPPEEFVALIARVCNHLVDQPSRIDSVGNLKWTNVR